MHKVKLTQSFVYQTEEPPLDAPTEVESKAVDITLKGSLGKAFSEESCISFSKASALEMTVDVFAENSSVSWYLVVSLPFMGLLLLLVLMLRLVRFTTVRRVVQGIVRRGSGRMGRFRGGTKSAKKTSRKKALPRG